MIDTRKLIRQNKNAGNTLTDFVMAELEQSDPSDCQPSSAFSVY